MKHRAICITSAFVGLAMSTTGSNAAPSTDAVAGKRVFLRCAACHNVKPGAPNKIGPNLAGIVGKKAATVKNFRYSPALAKANITWNAATMDKWLTRPSSVVPGTSMAFAGLPSAADRKAVIAYLAKPVP